MKRVLLIGSVDIYGGVGHMIFEFCRNINRDAVQFDFLYYKDISIEEQKVIDSCHGTFYKVPRYTKHPLQFYKRIKEFFQTHEYDIVHIHASTAMLIMYVLPVWRSEKTKIFYQGHNDCVDGMANKIVHLFIRHLVVKYANCIMAVSESAARFMYGKKRVAETVILKNGMDIKKYEFNEEIRKKIRKNLEIKDDFVLGHVGRFTYQKNHPFIIEVFDQMYKINRNTKLLLVGSGEDEDKIKQMVREKNLTEKVIFYGVSHCVEELLCAMDCFIFPSHYEGLGIVALEAQANGLPIVASEHVPKEANVTELYRTLSLSKDSPLIWANTILAFKEKQIDRQLRYQNLAENGYDIQEVAGKLERMYGDA
ncbi:MAG: glycosyltransferase family 1 protein [Lachnospiraceae bacterium]|nr:glycosyltransferase family 1 protein [Lachnospiraceae bacterium]